MAGPISSLGLIKGDDETIAMLITAEAKAEATLRCARARMVFVKWEVGEAEDQLARIKDTRQKAEQARRDKA